MNLKFISAAIIATLTSGTGISSQPVDKCITGIAAPRRGRRLHDRLSGTRVMLPDWNGYRAGFYHINDMALGKALFLMLYLLGWLVALALPAWCLFRH
jgi:hypothetical protein